MAHNTGETQKLWSTGNCIAEKTTGQEKKVSQTHSRKSRKENYIHILFRFWWGAEGVTSDLA